MQERTIDSETIGTKTANLLDALRPIVEHLQQEALQDEKVRAQLRTLGEALLALAPEPIPAPPAVQLEQSPAQTPATGLPEVSKPLNNGYSPTHSTTTNGTVTGLREQLRVLRTIDQTSSWRTVLVSDDDLPLIAERCHLKAEGARWAAQRQQLLRDSADYDSQIEPNDREIIARAKMLPECFLWMCHRDGPTPDDLSEYETLAGCFEAAAAAMHLLNGVVTNPDEDRNGFTDSLELAAEAQSALRIAIADMGGNTDSDQYKIFQWLKQTGSEQQILIRRHMRKDDPADPSQWESLIERIHELEERIESNRGRAKRQRSTFNKIRYHLKLIDQNRGQERSYDWQKVLDGIDDLVNDGIPPSNRDLRDLLLSVAEEIPETLELPKNVELVLRELEQFLTSRPVVQEETATPVLTEDVQRAAELLRGRTVVLIGGIKRPLAADALTQAFDLKELVWVEGRDQTYAEFEPYVARPDVAAVILAIRWSRHGFGEVKEFCDKYDKPLVRLPGGYSPNQVALHIVNQIGERLSNRTPEFA
jgi:hypothetical protein